MDDKRYRDNAQRRKHSHNFTLQRTIRCERFAFMEPLASL